MTPFNWVQFLEANHIPFLREGKNVARNHVNIACPFCGSDDPSEHMGLSLETGAWACWRNASHRGANPARLVMALKRCTWEEAKALVGAGGENTAPQGLESLAVRAARLFSTSEQKEDGVGQVEVPKEFRPIRRPGGVRGICYDYLDLVRGFGSDTPDLCRAYDLRSSISGRWRGRVILPFIADGKWVGWTGRSVVGGSGPRYLSYPSSNVVKQVLYNQDALKDKGAKLWVLVEGPFDVLKLDFYGRRFGVRAVASLGTYLSPSQRHVLLSASEEVSRPLAVVFDDGALPQAWQTAERLACLEPTVRSLPHYVKDPGSLAPGVAAAFARTLLASCT